MVHLNTLTFRWMMGIFCAALGALMLIVPHQYAAPGYAGVQPLLPVWGSALLVAGGGLLLAAGIFVRQQLIRGALLFAALVIGTLAVACASRNGMSEVSLYSVLAVGLVLAVAPSSAGLRPDLFALTIAANNLLTGITLLLNGLPDQAALYGAWPFAGAALGVIFLMGGVALIVVQYWLVRSGALLGLAHGLAALPMLLFLGLIAIPMRIWPAILYYGEFGLAVLLLPWLAGRLNRVIVGSLRARLALAFTALAVLPLVATLAFITDRDERLAIDQALNEQHLLALTVATTISHNPSGQSLSEVQRILTAQQIERGTQVVILDAAYRVLATADPTTPASPMRLPPGLPQQRATSEVRYLVAGEPWLAGIAPVIENNWLVVVTRPVSSALGRVHSGREDVFVILGTVALFAAACGVLTARWLTKPLRDLTSAAQALAESNGSPRLPQTDVAEIAQLTTTFGTMRERLQARTTERDWADEQRMQLLQQEHDARLAAEQSAARTMRLQSVTAALAQSLSSAQIADAVTGEGVAALGAVAGVVAICTPDNAMLEVIGSAGYSPEVSRGWERFPISAEVPLSEAVRTGKAVFLESMEDRIRRYPSLPSASGENRSVATVALPLLINGTVVGAIGFSMRDYRLINADERTFMETLGRLCSQALDRTWLFEGEQAARAEAEAAVRVRETFLSVASHELKTPLTSLYGHAELLERRTSNLGEEGDRLRRSVTVILDQTRRLNRLIATLLDVSRIRNGKLDIDEQIVDLGALIQQVIAELAPLLVNHTLHFTTPQTVDYCAWRPAAARTGCLQLAE